MSKIDKIMEKVQTGEMQYRDLVLSVREETEEPDHIVQGYASTYNEPYYLYRVKAPDGYTIEVREEVDTLLTKREWTMSFFSTTTREEFSHVLQTAL